MKGFGERVACTIGSTIAPPPLLPGKLRASGRTCAGVSTLPGGGTSRLPNQPKSENVAMVTVTDFTDSCRAAAQPTPA